MTTHVHILSRTFKLFMQLNYSFSNYEDFSSASISLVSSKYFLSTGFTMKWRMLAADTRPAIVYSVLL